MKLRTKLTVMLLAILMLLGAANVALAAKEGDFEYKIENGTAIITDYTGKAKELTIPATLGGKPVTAIGEFAFCDCTSLITVIIPDSVTLIDDNAFRQCTSLTNVDIPDSVTFIGGAFYGCTSLRTVIIPDSVKLIDSHTFNGCTSLTSITIPDTVTSIGWYAFKGCTSLISITIPDSVTVIDKDAFNGCSGLTTVNTNSNAAKNYRWGDRVRVGLFEGDFEYEVSGKGVVIKRYTGSVAVLTIPATLGGLPVRGICNSAFTGCTGLTIISIPDSVMYIEKDAFKGCSRLARVISDADCAFTYNWGTGVLVGFFEGDFCYRISGGKATIYCYTGSAAELTIPAMLGGKHVTSIGVSAFNGCTGLTSIIIPDSVTSVGKDAFRGCTSLTTITIPDSVTVIGDSAFSGCTSLTSVTIPDSVTVIGDSVFSGCGSLTSVTIPDFVTSINYSMFYRCTSLTTITIPDTVTSIGISAFNGCTSLTTIAIPDTVTSIGNSAFSGCTGLTIVIIPDSVTSIGNNTFYGCTSLTTVTIPDTVISIGDSAFKDCTSLTEVNTSCAAALSYPWPAGVRVGMFDGEFSFVPMDDTAYCLMSYSGDASVVIVPSTYNGKPVTKIDGEAFDKSVTLFVTGKTPFVASNPCWRYAVNAVGTICLTGTNITDSRLLLPSEACGTAITAIGDYAFGGMALSFVHIPDSIVTVGDNPFRGCMNLTTIVVNPENSGLYVSVDGALYSKADKRLVCFPAGVTASRLTIPEGVRSIGAYAMYKVRADEIVLPDSLTDIGVSAFADNSRLVAITLPDGIIEIPAGAFSGCTGLYTVTFPASLTDIGQKAFYNCGRLSVRTLPEALKGIGEQAFYDCDGLTEVTFPSALMGVGQSAFYDCDGLMLVYIANGTQSIGARAFAACENLQLVYLPASVTSIGAEAFSGAPLLTLQVQPGSPAVTYARENLLHALYPDSDSWLAE